MTRTFQENREESALGAKAEVRPAEGTSVPAPGTEVRPAGGERAGEPRRGEGVGEPREGERRLKVLLIASHAVQYATPQFRLMAQDPRVDALVAYCSLQGAEAGVDPEFGVPVSWDVPLLEGYRWVQVPNKARRPGLGRFFGLVNTGLWKLIRTGGFDAVVIYTGYAYASFWIALAAARSAGKALVYGTDGTSLRPRDTRWWKSWLKPLVAPRIFRMADVALVGSAAGAELMRSIGLPEERIALTPFAVDNEWWTQRAAEVDRGAVRREWGVPESSPVALYCAKLQPWKRPQDVLRAFARAGVADAYLVMAGEGPMRAELEAEAAALGVAERVRWLGFVNQSRLPATYSAADLFVLPSEYDPCPVVVCEAMLCGRPVVLSDEIRGRFDLVEPGKTGFIYRCGDVQALAGVLRNVLADRPRLAEMSAAARRRMETWSPRENLEAFVDGIERAVRRKSEQRAGSAS